MLESANGLEQGFGGRSIVFGNKDQTSISATGPGNLERKKSQRLRFMLELYDMVDGFDAQPVETPQLAARLGLDTNKPDDLLEVLKIVHYLQGEQLLTASGSSGDAMRLTLTHKGVREVEEARSRPDQPTEHFWALDTLTPKVAGGSNSDQNGAAAVRTLAVLEEHDRLEVLRMAQSLREWADRLALDEEQRAEYDADIRTIEAQLDSPHPKTALIGVALESIKYAAGKANSSPGSTGGIVSSGIASTIDQFVTRF